MGFFKQFFLGDKTSDTAGYHPEPNVNYSMPTALRPDALPLGHGGEGYSIKIIPPPPLPAHTPPIVHPDHAKEKVQHRFPEAVPTTQSVPETLTAVSKTPSKALTSYTGVIEFNKVSKVFGDKVAIQEITFTIKNRPTGNIVALVGPSGCGKSTVLRIIAGLTPQFPHTTGDAYVMGNPIIGASADRGMVDQRYSLLPHLTVVDNIAFGLKLRGESGKARRDRAKEWVKKVGLEGAEDKYPFELSGGMQQRVSLAATLILEPKILLMDEPFGALDPKIRLRMQELLVSLWKEINATVIIVTHSMEEAVYLGDKVYRMEANPGRLVEILDAPRPEISPEEMRKRPWFREMVDELTNRVESGVGAKGSLVKLPTNPKTADELEMFRLLG